MVSFLSNAFFKSFSSKYVYVQDRQQQWRPLMYSLPNILYMFSCGSHTHMYSMWSAALNKRLQLYICFLTTRRSLQTHPLTLFQYALLKYFLRCQIIQNNSDPAQWLHRVWGRGGGDDGNYWHNKQMNSRILNDIGRNSLLGKRKKIAKFVMRTFTYRSTFLYGLERLPEMKTLQQSSRFDSSIFRQNSEVLQIKLLSIVHSTYIKKTRSYGSETKIFYHRKIYFVGCLC